MSKKGFIFDLDGVIVDTAKYHFLAWKELANGLGINFSEKENEQLKGVSRVASLTKILEWGDKKLEEDEFMRLMAEKNHQYLSYIASMTESEILPDVPKVLKYLIGRNQSVALGSASKNARAILKQVNLDTMFHVIVDGNDVTKAKPDPEVFVNAASAMQMDPEDCVVFEDSVAGIRAANIAGMISIGIGNREILNEADFVFKGFTEINTDFIERIIEN